jgi:acetate kinase
MTVSNNKDMKVLVINAGSSSLKYQLYQMPQSTVLCKGIAERIGDSSSQLKHQFNGKTVTIAAKFSDHEDAMHQILKVLMDKEIGAVRNNSEIGAVGHRVVHGGEEFTGSVLINHKVVSSIEKFADLAPLHNPPNLTGISAAKKELPGVPQVACFDTAFHASIPKVAHLYALPVEFYEKFRVRRYGFHGTNHRYVARRAAQLMGVGKYEANLITIHLGNGCSITAVENGRSADTSMGLTPLEGLVMGTRSGDFDPAIIFYLAQKGYDIESLNEICNKKSGLLGVSGKSNDMRNLLALAGKADESAALAIDIFCYRVRKYIGAYTAVLGRVDAVVFTGGIGENAAIVRSKICSGLGNIGIEIDAGRNNSAKGTESLISTGDSKVRVYVIGANEEAAIAADTYEIASKEVSK